MWTLFWDMHSGGYLKLPWHYIYIELPEAEARAVFTARFERDPDHVTCPCCGEDYAVSEEDPDLQVATAYHRGCATEYVREDGTAITESAYYNMPYRERQQHNWQPHYVERPRYSGTALRTLEEFMQDPEVNFYIGGKWLK